MLNWALIKHPINWITVFVMCIVGTMLLNLILSPWHMGAKNTEALAANSEPTPILMSYQ